MPFPSSSLSPPWASSLLTHAHPASPVVTHTFLLRIPLVQTLLCAPCAEQQKQTSSAAQTETELQDYQERRQS